jgi:hypothetical protein
VRVGRGISNSAARAHIWCIASRDALSCRAHASRARKLSSNASLG